ncbi:MAG: hypothetical protein R3E84_21950 [Pseudomonadales bacterium]
MQEVHALAKGLGCMVAFHAQSHAGVDSPHALLERGVGRLGVEQWQLARHLRRVGADSDPGLRQRLKW